MPIPLAPLLPLLLRIGAVTAAGYAAGRILARSVVPARRDQRVEDALDDLDEGLAYRSDSRQGDTAEPPSAFARDHAASFRLKRRITLGERDWDVDAAFVGRLRLRRRLRDGLREGEGG